jgi:hypothetical protein
MAASATIKEHMEVYGSDHILVGVVDHMEGDDMIKLTKSDSADGQHHYVDADLVDHVDTHVHLSKPADEVMAEWEDDMLELSVDDEEVTEIDENEKQKQEEWIERRR